MKRIVTATLVVLLATVAVAASGCTLFANPTADANTAIAAANTHLNKAAASATAAQKLENDLSASDLTPAGATAALGIVTQLNAEREKQQAELEAAKKAIVSIKALDVKDEYKKYADLEAKGIATRISIVTEGQNLYSQMQQMYEAIRDKKTNNLQTQKITTQIDQIMNNIAALTEQAKTDSDAASAYYDKNIANK